MAKVTLTIYDEDAANVRLTAQFEPPMSREQMDGAVPLTQAQHLAAELIQGFEKRVDIHSPLQVGAPSKGNG